jgi:rhodanese-related sulfurtransferase
MKELSGPRGRFVPLGYTNVAHYPEGKQGWTEAGFPVEQA